MARPLPPKSILEKLAELKARDLESKRLEEAARKVIAELCPERLNGPILTDEDIDEIMELMPIFEAERLAEEVQQRQGTKSQSDSESFPEWDRAAAGKGPLRRN